ncbi:MAG TPA: hypothetical protein VHY37_04605 [Tepidisphaeraceae bacterium]|jgi:hypothetical protein|nr:hypothetical protein [Tepidisphaeraceae bacterium]
MKARWFNFAVLVSSVFATGIICLWILAASGHIDGQKPLVSFSKGCHFTIYGRDADYRLAFYNDAAYGPYHGSIIGMVRRDGWSPIKIIEHGFGDTAGTYYRHFRWPWGSVLWTLMISFAWPLGLSMVLPLLWFCVHFRLRRPAK